MAVEHADEPGNCLEPSTTPDSFMGGFCTHNFTSGPAKGNFCWDRRPEYSAYRESSFGHGILEVKNESTRHMHYGVTLGISIFIIFIGSLFTFPNGYNDVFTFANTKVGAD